MPHTPDSLRRHRPATVHPATRVRGCRDLGTVACCTGTWHGRGATAATDGADADARMFRKPSQLSAVYHVTCNRIDGAPHESVCGEASDHATHVPRHVYRPYFIILPLPGTTWLWIQSPSAFMPAILCQRVLNVSQHRARRARRGWGCQCEP